MVAQARTAAKDSVVATASLDDQLIENCQRGDRESFRPLVEQYGDVVFGTILLMTRDQPLAEDLTQETFLHAWRGIGSFQIGAPFKPWLLRIAVNRVTSHRRRKWLNIVPLVGNDQRAPDASPETVFEQQSEHERVRSAITKLSGREQQLLTLRYFGELSVPEIASALGWPEGTVKSRLHRALGAMRELLREQEVLR
jgi:RNA polymerase sigma-70 factor (ECF subfamily)